MKPRYYLLIVRGDIVELKGPFPSDGTRAAWMRGYCKVRGKGGQQELHTLDINEFGTPTLNASNER